MKFEQYKIISSIKESLADMGFKRPTDIQYKSIPHILKGEDVLAIAQTGTGKTAAFAIPLLDMLARQEAMEGAAPLALVMVPTRELGIQIQKAVAEIGKYTKVRSLAIFGGVEQDPQIEQLQKGVELVIATPGRLFDLQAQGHLNLKFVKVLVLDEADQMLKLGFYQDIKDLLERLPKERQTLFFSATIDKKIKKLAYSLVNNAIRIQISPKDPVNKNIDHSLCFMEMEDKKFFLERIYKENPERKILAFVRTKVRAERVCAAMEKANIESKALHGDKDQKVRIKTLEAFKKGDFRLLIATDVSARGIDIPDVDLVINYDLPDVAENYVHRVGRTGRGQKKGKAIAFCSPREEEELEAIEDYLGKRIKILKIDPTEYEATIDLSDSHLYSFKDVMRELEMEKEQKKKKRKKKK